MASIKFSALVNQLKGKLNGSVFQGSTSGAIVRNKPYFINGSRTGKLTKADAGRVSNQQRYVASISQEWGKLSDNDRQTWDTMAYLWPFKNRFGETYIGSGYQVFQMVNLRLLHFGYPIVSVCPTPAGNQPTLPPVQILPDWFTDEWWEEMVLACEWHWERGYPTQNISVSLPIKKGRKSVGLSYSLIKTTTVNSDGIFDVNIGPELEKRFGRIEPPFQFWIKIDQISPTTGELAVPCYVLGSVYPAP
jgi:hypothetical protein